MHGPRAYRVIVTLVHLERFVASIDLEGNGLPSDGFCKYPLIHKWLHPFPTTYGKFHFVLVAGTSTILWFIFITSKTSELCYTFIVCYIPLITITTASLHTMLAFLNFPLLNFLLLMAHIVTQLCNDNGCNPISFSPWLYTSSTTPILHYSLECNNQEGSSLLDYLVQP